MILKDASLFLEINCAIHHLAERLMGKNKNDFLIVVLTSNAMRVAGQIGKKLDISVIQLPREGNTVMNETSGGVSFDYNKINSSARDLPQNFVLHQGQNLRASLMSLYAETYKNLAIKFAEKVVILVDELIYKGHKFYSSLSQRGRRTEESLSPHMYIPNGVSDKSKPRFVLLHAVNECSSNGIAQDFDIIIEEELG